MKDRFREKYRGFGIVIFGLLMVVPYMLLCLLFGISDFVSDGIIELYR